MNYKKAGFTLVELIVVVTILAILATIWFMSFFWYQISARDSVRISDLWNISKSIELLKLQTWSFPQVTDPINVTFSWSVIWQQGSFWKASYVDAARLSELPLDPLTSSEYAYSTTTTTGEYQLWAILEWSSISYSSIIPSSYAATNDFSYAYTTGSYNGRFLVHSEAIDNTTNRVYVLWVPSILATNTSDVTIEDILTNNTLVYSGRKISPSTYSWTVSRNNDWSFAPQITSHGTNRWSIAVVYEWTSDELSTWTGKIDLVNSLKTYYESTDLQSEDTIDDFIDIDTSTAPNDAIVLVNTFVSGDLGWLETTKVETSVIESTGWGGGWSSWPASCTDMTATHLANLNNMWWTLIGPTLIPWWFSAEVYEFWGPSSYTIAQWCSVTEFMIPSEESVALIEEIALLENITFLSASDTYQNSLPPESFINLDNLTAIDFSSNSWFWNLNNYFESDATKVCEAGSYSWGSHMCIEWNGTTIDITIETPPPACTDMTAWQLAGLNAWLDVTISSGGRWGIRWDAVNGTSSNTASDWCSIIVFDTGFTATTTYIPEWFTLFDNMTQIWMSDVGLTSLPDELVNLTTLEDLELSGSPALGNLNNYFDLWSAKTCQDAVTSSGQRMCFEGNGTTIDITIE